MSSWLSKLSITNRPRAAGSAEALTLPSTRFAFSLFEALKPGHRNIAISPYSARVVLAMLCEGSTGDTRKAMVQALHLDEDPNNQANHYERLGRPLGFQRLTDRLGLELLTANSLWCDDGFVPKPDYIAALKQHYWAEIQSLDFRSPLAAQTVNRWAHEKTRGKIPTVIGAMDALSPLLAMNAVYFKGQWLGPFKVEETHEEQFTLQDGTKKLLPLMRQSGSFVYTESAGAQIVRLPYEGWMSMYVILPPRELPFPKFCAEFTAIVGTSWTRMMGERPGHLRLPRFRIETQADLSAPLQAMGMSQVFDPARASLEGISDSKPLYLMGVLQSDFVEVNEKGTEAAAVTSMPLCAAMSRESPPPPFQMIVDRPFVFAICDNHSGAIVFLGDVADPLAA